MSIQVTTANLVKINVGDVLYVHMDKEMYCKQNPLIEQTYLELGASLSIRKGIYNRIV